MDENKPLPVTHYRPGESALQFAGRLRKEYTELETRFKSLEAERASAASFKPTPSPEPAYDPTPVRETLTAEIGRLKADRNEWKEKAQREEQLRWKALSEQLREEARFKTQQNSGLGFGGFLFLLMIAGLIFVGILNLIGNVDTSAPRVQTAMDQISKETEIKTVYLGKIIATAAKADRCDTPDHVQVNYRNETGRAIGRVKLNFAGYLPNRSTNIVIEPGPYVNSSHATLDWVVQPGSTQSDCVKLPLKEGAGNADEARFKVTVVDFKFLEDVDGYAEAFKEEKGATCPQTSVGPAPTSVARPSAERSHNWLEVSSRPRP